MKRGVFAFLAGFYPFLFLTLTLAAENPQPNIVLLLADDFGWGDTSCYNEEAVFKTPNIDRIAREGLRFINAFTPHSVCSPTRYALLTGRYAWRTRLREGVLPGYDKSLIPPERVTVASLLKRHGYHTGAFGKWHIGMDWMPIPGDPGDWHWGTQVRGKGVITQISQRVDHSSPIQNGPTAIGFDRAFVTPSNNTRIPVFVRDDRVDGSPARDEEGLMRDARVQRDSVDDVFRTEAIRFIDQHLAQSPDQPFFVYLPFNAIHGTTAPPKRFQGKTKDGERGDKVLWLDESVGVILDALDRRNLTRNTLLIFTSDNGPIAPKKNQTGSVHRAAGPFRGYKSDAWDGGFRVPFIVRWPGKIPAGVVHEGWLCLTDMLATFSALMQADLPAWAGEDSVNQLPALLGDLSASPRTEMITESEIGVLTIRKKPWKLILDTEGSGGHEGFTPGFEPLIQGPPWEIKKSRVGQLYHLQEDPYEQDNQIKDQPKIVNELKELLQQRINDGRSRPLE